MNKKYQEKYIFTRQIAIPMRGVIRVANTPPRPFTAAAKRIKKCRTFPVKGNHYQKILCPADDFTVVVLKQQAQIALCFSFYVPGRVLGQEKHALKILIR
jgi:hypothetical protein